MKVFRGFFGVKYEGESKVKHMIKEWSIKGFLVSNAKLGIMKDIAG